MSWRRGESPASSRPHARARTPRSSAARCRRRAPHAGRRRAPLHAAADERLVQAAAEHCSAGRRPRSRGVGSIWIWAEREKRDRRVACGQFLIWSGEPGLTCTNWPKYLWSTRCTSWPNTSPFSCCSCQPTLCNCPHLGARRCRPYALDSRYRDNRTLEILVHGKPYTAARHPARPLRSVEPPTRACSSLHHRRGHRGPRATPAT
jgi:hypothetical protein